jgi:hypothetical protein
VRHGAVTDSTQTEICDEAGKTDGVNGLVEPRRIGRDPPLPTRHAHKQRCPTAREVARPVGSIGYAAARG